MPLQALRHQAAHHVRRLGLLTVRGVGVGAQGEASVGMAQHSGESSHVHAVLEHDRGCGVSQIVQANMRQPRAFQDLLMEPVDGVRVVHPAGHRGGEHIRVLRVLSMLILQQADYLLGYGDRADGSFGLRPRYSRR